MKNMQVYLLNYNTEFFMFDDKIYKKKRIFFDEDKLYEFIEFNMLQAYEIELVEIEDCESIEYKIKEVD